MGWFGLPGFSSHTTKVDKITFSDRQKLRKANELPAELKGDDESISGPLPTFRSHRRKPDKVTFSERQRIRKAGGIPDDETFSAAINSHRVKDHVTFSERQKRRREGRLSATSERDSLLMLDGDYGAAWPDHHIGFGLEDQRQKEHFEVEEEEHHEQEGTAALVPTRTTMPAKRGFGFKLKLGTTAKRLLSGALSGGISRTAVAPLETIRTHLMVGNSGKKSIGEVFNWIVATEGWKGLYRGNGLNVLRVAPSKAIELFTYDTVRKALTPKDGSAPRFPVSPIAGSSAGIASCILTYPLELVKTRLTVQPGAYSGVFNAFVRIAQEEGFLELYRGLVPSVIGVVPYAGANYYAYDTLRTLYKKVAKKDKIGNLATLAIGASAGAVASTATFPLEVARKQMQVGALSGRVVYKGTLDALFSIFKAQGVAGLYRGLFPSCVKLMPAAGISFMCYEAFKQLLIEEDEVPRKVVKVETINPQVLEAVKIPPKAEVAK
eukprot:TRINITY_DN35718_c0_g1_i1.p1 TRINITY_DN35718_c0_g1~~TRINITY_DN35718_c0_g1_i1.p1  ORF type:complete len:493 (+),score=96.37 TRINITY_DN35718_c0_g1_i1:255-1733(+)